MNPAITEYIKSWRLSSGEYSFESRFAFPQNVGGIIPQGTTHKTFIIEVGGFFEDKAHTKPIKLHYEDVLSIDDMDMTQQYFDDFVRRLNAFTDDAYQYFQIQLSSLQQPPYTSDSLHMKSE